MTRPALRAAGALLFLSTLPAFAATQPRAVPAGEVLVKAPPAALKPRPAPAPPSPTFLALSTAFKEFRAGRTTRSYLQWLDTLPGFRYAPATSAMLIKQLGTDKLFSVQREDVAAGGRAYLFTAPALRHTDPEGSSFSWDTMQGQWRVQPDGITIVNQLNVPRMAMEDKTMRFEARALSASGTASDSDTPYGDLAGEIGHLEVLVKADGSRVALDGLFGKFSVTDQGNSAAMAYETGVRTVTAQDERIDDLHLAMHFNGLDKVALAKFSAMSRQMQAQQDQLSREASPAQRSAVIMPMLRQLGMVVMAKGASIDLDDISFSYHGNKASLRGQVRMENLAPADLDQPAALLKKVAGHADLQVPVAMMRAFAQGIARKQLAKQQPGADAATIAKAGAAAYDAMLRTALANGFVRLDGDMLVTTIDIRDGVMLVNGKPLQLPKPDAPVGMAAGMMRARRIAEKCTLPDFPPDVVKQDSALSLAMQLTVNPDGSVGKLALARTSGLPAYDQAVLAAAAQCTYIPALRNGKPVAVSELWEVVRAPGSVRP